MKTTRDFSLRRSTPVGAVLAFTIFAVVLAACSPARPFSDARASSTSSATAPATSLGTTIDPVASAPGTMKAPLTGLLDMGVQTAYQTGQPFPTTDPSTLDTYAGAFGGIVINESWSQLEPSPGVEQWAPLDQSLAAVQMWNIQHPATPLGVKLRIFAGYSAPSWVVQESGPSVTLHTRGGTKVVGEWWTTPFRQAWNSFQHALAARYDSNPLVRAVSVSSCSSSTGEPFVVSGAKSSQQALSAAGWTPQLQESCLEGALSDYSGWVHTPVDLAANLLGQGPSVGPSTAFTGQIMQACAASQSHGGPECVLGNNDLSSTVTSGSAGFVYSEIESLWQSTPAHVNVYFQTVGAGVNCQAIAVAVSHHATSVELWPPNGHYSGFSAIPLATLASWNTAVQTGAVPNCTS